MNGVKAKKTKEKLAVMLSRSRENLKFGHFTLLFCRGRQTNVLKCVYGAYGTEECNATHFLCLNEDEYHKRLSKFLVLSSENPGNDNIVSGIERS